MDVVVMRWPTYLRLILRLAAAGALCGCSIPPPTPSDEDVGGGLPPLGWGTADDADDGAAPDASDAPDEDDEDPTQPSQSTDGTSLLGDDPDGANDQDDADDLTGDCDNDGLSDMEELLLGHDELCNPYDGPDIDGDGIENGDDPDVDGDGIENGEDPDVDGDGFENGDDPDVDGDGFENGDDPDVDGDAIRNSFDFDIDGDTTLNPFDDDADGDGEEKGSDEDDDEGADDEGFDNPTEFDKFVTELERIVKEAEKRLNALSGGLKETDSEASDDEVLAAATDVIEGALASNPPDEDGQLDTEAIGQDVEERTEAIGGIDGIEPNAGLRKIADAVTRLGNFSKEQGVPFAGLVETVKAVGEHQRVPNMTDALNMVERLVAEVISKEMPKDMVGSLGRIAQMVEGDERITEVWGRVTDFVVDARDDEDAGMEASTVIETIESTVVLMNKAAGEEPTSEQLLVSSGNILEAARNQGVDDPKKVVEALNESDAKDGVTADEAAAAAESVAPDDGGE